MLPLLQVSVSWYNAVFMLHSVQDVKEQIVSQVKAEAEQYLDTAMTYTLFEFVKEKLEELLAGQPDSFVSDMTNSVDRITMSGTQVQIQCTIHS
jgi:hypothetical protein